MWREHLGRLTNPKISWLVDQNHQWNNPNTIPKASTKITQTQSQSRYNLAITNHNPNTNTTTKSRKLTLPVGSPTPPTRAHHRCTWEARRRPWEPAASPPSRRIWWRGAFFRPWEPAGATAAGASLLPDLAEGSLPLPTGAHRRCQWGTRVKHKSPSRPLPPDLLEGRAQPPVVAPPPLGSLRERERGEGERCERERQRDERERERNVMDMGARVGQSR